MGDQSVSPVSLLFRVAARFIDLCLLEFPATSHFDVSSTQALVKRLQQFCESPCDNILTLEELRNYDLIVGSRDVDNGYMRTLHEEVEQAWKKVAEVMRARGKTKAWE